VLTTKCGEEWAEGSEWQRERRATLGLPSKIAGGLAREGCLISQQTYFGINSSFLKVFGENFIILKG